MLLVPVLDGWVIEQIVAWDPGPRLDPLLAAIALFAPVSIVLAAATPIAVRLAARSLERLGRTAGRLFSVSTAGSIAGTFVAAFWLVPELGTDQVLAVARRHAARRGDRLRARRAPAAGRAALLAVAAVAAGASSRRSRRRSRAASRRPRCATGRRSTASTSSATPAR